MRTTIDISDEHRAALLALAAKRGVSGYSQIIKEALDFYLPHHKGAEDSRENVLKMRGSWGERDARQVKERIRELRNNWIK